MDPAIGDETVVSAGYRFVDPAIRDQVGVVWYQRAMQVPRGWAGERITLRVPAAFNRDPSAAHH